MFLLYNNTIERPADADAHQPSEEQRFAGQCNCVG